MSSLSSWQIAAANLTHDNAAQVTSNMIDPVTNKVETNTHIATYLDPSSMPTRSSNMKSFPEVPEHAQFAMTASAVPTASVWSQLSYTNTMPSDQSQFHRLPAVVPSISVGAAVAETEGQVSGTMSRRARSRSPNGGYALSDPFASR